MTMKFLSSLFNNVSAHNVNSGLGNLPGEISEPSSISTESQPLSMRDLAVRERRRAMLNLPHMLPLKMFAEKLRRPGFEVPDFDPADGGVEARALFLFEKPGPMTVTGSRGKRSGSGFISRDNDDPTAEAIFNFMREAEIPRGLTIMWNVIPWWNGTRAVTTPELQDGESSLSELLRLLPKLKAIMLVGQRATRARSYCENSGRLRSSIASCQSALAQALERNQIRVAKGRENHRIRL
jgi:hypothetical protein